MTRKPPLYACAAGVLLGALAAPGAAQEGPPCAACVSLGVPVAAFRSLPPTPAVTVVLRTGDLVDPSQDVRGVRAVVLDAETAGSALERAFDARRALAELRGLHPSVRLGIVGASRLLEALLEHDLAPYVDLVVATDLTTATRARWERAHPGLEVWGAAPLDAFGDLVSASAAAADGGLLIWPSVGGALEIVRGLTQLAGLLPEGLVPLPDALVRCDPADACQIAAYQRADTLQPIVVVRRARERPARLLASGAPLEILAVSAGTAQGLRAEPVRALVPPLAQAARPVPIAWPAHTEALVLRMASREGAVAEDVRVVGARQLTAAEIVARHQAVAARQSRLVRTLVTHARSTVTFEVPAFPAPVTVQAETTAFQGGGPTELAQRNVRINGVAFTSSGVPRLPLIEPERVAAPPLAITLTRAYRYALAGRAAVRGREAYVLAFEPDASAAGESLFRGRAWIDSESFALLRVNAVQTNLRGPITSSEQIEDFREQAVEGQPVWLLSRSELRQVYQGAGLTTPIHRVLVVERHEINPADMEERRRAAHASPAIMLRETPDGLRYLRRADAEGGTARREPAGRATRIRTLAGGIIVDPNITRPLPFAGVNYTDFDLLGTGAQLNAFFGGAYGQAALSAPSLGGTRWQLRAEAFAMLARYNDRAFRDGRERYEENVRQRPLHASLGVSRPVSARTALHAAYVFDHVALSPADTTSPSFVVPGALVVHGARLALETQRAGWRGEAWWNPGRRADWRAWGWPDGSEYRPRDASFQRFGVSASRPWVLGPRLLVRAELAAMTGRDLDRFSRFAFGTFDNRLRGYPSASIRYDRGVVARTAVAWQTARRLRLDGFADVATVRDRGFGEAYRAYPGLGAAIEAPGPFGLLFGVEWGFGVRGLSRDGSRGTHVVRATTYKVF